MTVEGFHHLRGFVRARAGDLADAALDVARQAPWLRPATPGGGTMSVQITSCGHAGWWSDRRGYRYVERHPETGALWPPVPEPVAAAVRDALDAVGHTHPYALDSCLVNLYRSGAKMGLHRDEDEEDRAAPIVSISLGDSCEFLIGGYKRGDPASAHLLQSGDVVVLAGAARGCFHGVRRVFTGSSDLIPGCRINLTARQVWPARAPRPMQWLERLAPGATLQQ
jgi:alkylated DNA repair protein (DNA oxidative demethylase)